VPSRFTPGSRSLHWLERFNDGLPDNPKVRLRQQGKNLIHQSPLDRQAEPPNTAALVLHAQLQMS
jgi:hypothetical protein